MIKRERSGFKSTTNRTTDPEMFKSAKLLVRHLMKINANNEDIKHIRIVAYDNGIELLSDAGTYELLGGRYPHLNLIWERSSYLSYDNFHTQYMVEEDEGAIGIEDERNMHGRMRLDWTGVQMMIQKYTKISDRDFN